jgi:cytochrome P450
VRPCEIGGYPLEPKSVVLVAQWVTHRDGRFWPEPQRFWPERWLQQKSDRPRYAYFPFGGGSRSCIGEAFAWMEATLILATLAQRWRMELLDRPPIDVQPTITLRPRHGVRVRLLRRNA